VAHGNHLHAFAQGMMFHVIKTEVATLTLVQDESFDQNKCVRMALIHDIGEAIIGDITPSDGVSKGMWPTN
jgi:5'-deoxynucleotidase YfbR-like HD superfamily hydrolase